MNAASAVMLFVCAAAPVASAVSDTRLAIAEQVKALDRKAGQIDEQLPRSTVYARTEQVDGDTIVYRAWFNGVGDLLKAISERSGPSGVERTEFTPSGLEIWHDGLLTVTRKEVPTADGGKQVDEARRYYGGLRVPSRWGGTEFDNGVLLREVKKTAHFRPGEALDTAKVREVKIDYPKTPQFTETDEDQARQRKVLSEPRDIALDLQKTTPPEVDPHATVTGDSERFRLIHGSASPDGRFAFAVGFEQAPDWSKYRDRDYKDEETYTVPDQPEELRNYIVEIATRRILGATAGKYPGSRSRYNLHEFSTFWSDDSSTFVVRDSEKWHYVSCYAGRIAPGPKLLGVVDLGAAAEKHAMKFPKARRHAQEASINIGIEDVQPDGTVRLELYGQQASGPEKGEIYFTIKETLRLRETPAGLELSLVSARPVASK